MKSHRYDPINQERERNLRAARAPQDTFYCACCGLLKRIVGRRRIGKVWKCGACVQEAA